MAKFVLETDEQILQRVPGWSSRHTGTVRSELIITDQRVVLTSEKQPPASLHGILSGGGAYRLLFFLLSKLGRMGEGFHVTHDVAREDIEQIEPNGSALH